jgi:hypothetical protein
MKRQRHLAAPGAVGQGSTCGTRRWRDVEHDGAVGHRDGVIRALSELGWSRRAIAARLRLTFAAVLRAQLREGGAS